MALNNTVTVIRRGCRPSIFNRSICSSRTHCMKRNCLDSAVTLIHARPNAQNNKQTINVGFEFLRRTCSAAQTISRFHGSKLDACRCFGPGLSCDAGGEGHLIGHTHRARTRRAAPLQPSLATSDVEDPGTAPTG